MESEMVTVKYDDLSTAFDFVSFAGPMEHRAYVSLDTGAIYWISETNPIEEDDLPADLETSERYLAVPHKNDLDLGTNLALRFIEERLPDRTRTSRPPSGAAALTRDSRSFSQRKAVSKSGTHSRRSRPSERSGTGAVRIEISTWPGTTVNNRPDMACSRRRFGRDRR